MEAEVGGGDPSSAVHAPGCRHRPGGLVTHPGEAGRPNRPAFDRAIEVVAGPVAASALYYSERTAVDGTAGLYWLFR